MRFQRTPEQQADSPTESQIRRLGSERAAGGRGPRAYVLLQVQPLEVQPLEKLQVQPLEKARQQRALVPLVLERYQTQSRRCWIRYDCALLRSSAAHCWIRHDCAL